MDSDGKGDRKKRGTGDCSCTYPPFLSGSALSVSICVHLWFLFPNPTQNHIMKTRTPTVILAALALLATLNPQLSTCFAQGTAFTYQGRLNDNGSLAIGIYD